MSVGDSHILVIDVGATSMKATVVDADGTSVSPTRRRLTPYPCSPEVLMNALISRIERTDCRRVAVGFPGEFRDGVVVHPGNLARSGGVETDINPELDIRWRGFSLTQRLCDETGRDVRVVNDALLAGFGAISGTGREAVITLGTGCGLSFFVNGNPVEVRDVGDAELRDGETFDQLIGEHARSVDPLQWTTDVHLAIRTLMDELGTTTIHLAGGNARRLSRDGLGPLDAHIMVHGNEVAARGAPRLFP